MSESTNAACLFNPPERDVYRHKFEFGQPTGTAWLTGDTTAPYGAEFLEKGVDLFIATDGKQAQPQPEDASDSADDDIQMTHCLNNVTPRFLAYLITFIRHDARTSRLSARPPARLAA